MPIDTRELSGKLIGQPVAPNTRCRRCEYDLTGLSSGGRCPECGAAIGLADAFSGRFADNLSDTPPHYLRFLMWSMIAFTVLAVALPAAAVRELVAGAGPADAAVFGAVALAWIGAVWLVTRQRAKVAHTVADATLDSARFRLVNRLLQVGWLVAALSALVLAAPAPAWMEIPLTVVYFAGALCAFIGLGTLSYYLSAMADWAGETGLGQRYLAAAWGLAVFTTLDLLASLVIMVGASNSGGLIFLAWVFRFVEIAAAVLSVIGFFLFLICNAQFTNTVRWALKNNLEAADRDLRIAERRAQRAQEEASRPSDAAAPPIATPGPVAGPAPAERAPGAAPWRPMLEDLDDDAPIPLVEPDPPPPER